MKALHIISGMLAICITLPIWYYILYQILTAIAASDLTWFLYYIYVPVGLFTSILGSIARSIK